MKTHFLKRSIVALWALAAIAVAGVAVMLLWNWLLPDIFGLPTLNFWQALGLFALARILFGGLGRRHWGGGFHAAHHNPIREKWSKMSPEEQKEFIRRRHGFFHKHHFDESRWWGENHHPEAPPSDAPKQEK
jgi:hypothetical protein